jgi:hypothetical protein
MSHACGCLLCLQLPSLTNFPSLTRLEFSYNEVRQAALDWDGSSRHPCPDPGVHLIVVVVA